MGKVPLGTLLCYSFVTLAGLGYGDITPFVPLTRTLAYFEVIGGQQCIADLLAGWVGLFLNELQVMEITSPLGACQVA